MSVCPLNNFNECRKDCNWYMKKQKDCAIPLVAVFTNNPTKNKGD
jgi:hypothetical protein